MHFSNRKDSQFTTQWEALVKSKERYYKPSSIELAYIVPLFHFQCKLKELVQEDGPPHQLCQLIGNITLRSLTCSHPFHAPRGLN